MNQGRWNSCGFDKVDGTSGIATKFVFTQPKFVLRFHRYVENIFGQSATSSPPTRRRQEIAVNDAYKKWRVENEVDNREANTAGMVLG